MRNIKLYDVHGASAISNYKTLFSPDNQYFYWDSRRFESNSISDIVFWVNRSENTILYCSIDDKTITPEFRNGKNEINNLGYSLSASAKDENQFKNFIRFKVLEKIEIPTGWNYSNLSTFNGQTMAIKLWEPGIDEPHKRIEKIRDIRSLMSNESEAAQLLDEALSLLNGGSGYPVRTQNLKSPEFNNRFNQNILTAIKTKPFILLAGISGTGKSRLVRTLAYQTCPKGDLRADNNKPGNFELISVRPNWHDSTELLGYVSRISNPAEYIITPFLRFLVKAWQYPNVPFFLCLDEMNLAPVEQYFAEYLSIIETRQVKNDELRTDFILSKEAFQDDKLYDRFIHNLQTTDSELFNEGIRIPPNLVVMGTVNMDETTHSFSRKVLDRAMTIEMNEVDLFAGLEPEKEDWNYPSEGELIHGSRVIGNYTAGWEVAGKMAEKDQVLEYLQKVNSVLDGSPFKIAYRVRDEFLIYCQHASENGKTDGWLDSALDEMTCMKILARIEGDENKTGDILKNLSRFVSGYPKSQAKIKEMQNRLVYGYTSFWA